MNQAFKRGFINKALEAGLSIKQANGLYAQNIVPTNQGVVDAKVLGAQALQNAQGQAPVPQVQMPQQPQFNLQAPMIQPAPGPMSSMPMS